MYPGQNAARRFAEFEQASLIADVLLTLLALHFSCDDALLVAQAQLLTWASQETQGNVKSLHDPRLVAMHLAPVFSCNSNGVCA